MKEKSEEWLRKEIEKTNVLLEEARENYEEKPGDYSAKLLLLSTENYLIDLLKELDIRNVPPVA